jgi:predicted ATPase
MDPGSKVADRYLVERLAGEGGMGRVYRALDLSSNAPVALKVLGERGRRERFAVEADALSALEHPAIVRYVAHGLLPSGQPYMVMEWLEGEDLRSRLRRRGLTLQESLSLALVLVDVLEHIHARGVIHRDLKPANIMLPTDDVRSAKVVDFGIARLASGRALTATGLRVGSTYYMSPEQYSHPRLVDGRTDVFALGCILFECLTGRRAFEAEDELAVVARIVLEQAPSACAMRPSVPVAVDALVARLLARERAHRPSADAALRASIDALQAEFATFEFAAATDVTVEAPAIMDTADEVASTVAPGRLAEPPKNLPALPKPQHPIVGRESELAQLEGLLASGGVVTVWGPAGIGKTRLALESARRWAAADATRGAVFVNLRQAVDADGALRAIALALQPSSPPAGTTDEVESSIGRMLRVKGSFALVLDGIEHVAARLGPALERWGAVGTDARLLATSRQRATAGMLVELGPLPTDTESSAAVELFVQRSAVLESEPDARSTLLRIARVLDGNPLAIELAAARLELLGPRVLLERLSKRPLELLGGTSAQGAPLTMTEALAWSWGLLREDEKLALAKVSVFCGSFTAQAAEAVIDAPSGAAVLDLLQSLRDKSLLGSALGRATTRISISASVREYASERLAELGLGEQTRDKHAEYFVAMTAPLAERVVSRGDVIAFQALAAETDELLAAWEHARRRSLPTAFAALLALDPLLATRGPSGKHREMLDEALRAEESPTVDRHVVSRLRQARGRVLTRLGRHDDARADLDLALADARQSGDRVGEASCLLDLGMLHHATRNLDEARRLYEAVTLLDTDNALIEARALGNLGAMHHDGHRFDDAYACYVEAIALFESLGDPKPIGLFLANLAMLDFDRGRIGDAARRFGRAVARLESAEAPRLLAIALGSLGMLELGEGEIAAAIAHHERSYALLEEVGDPRSEALCLGRLGAALACQGSLEAATAAMAKGERIGRRDQVARDTLRLFRAFLDAAHAKEAAADHRTAEARAALDAARGRIEVARELLDTSDDARAAHRVLGPLLERLERALEPQARH